MKHLLLLLFLLPFIASAQINTDTYQYREEISDGGVLNGTYHNFRQFYIENRHKIKIDQPGVEARRKKLEKAREVQKTAPRTRPRRTASSNGIGKAPRMKGGYKSRNRGGYDSERHAENEAKRRAWAEAEATAKHAQQLIAQQEVFDAQNRAKNFKPSTTSADMIVGMELESDKGTSPDKVDLTAGLIPLEEEEQYEEEDMDPVRLVARYEAGDTTLSYNQMEVVIGYYENDLAAYNELVEENTNKLDINPKKESK